MRLILYLFLCTMSITLNCVNGQFVEPYTDERCQRRGCNGELCALKSDPEIISTCIWKDVYFCYQNAECWFDETNQTCYWSYNKFLKSCLLDYPKDTYENCIF